MVFVVLALVACYNNLFTSKTHLFSLTKHKTIQTNKLPSYVCKMCLNNILGSSFLDSWTDWSRCVSS